MIISHKNKFIFMHCRKCAGTSTKVYLNECLGQLDIQVGSWNGTLKNGGRINIRYLYDLLTSGKVANIPKCMLKRKKIDIDCINRAHDAKFVNYFGTNPGHPEAKKVSAVYSREWENYFKFGFIRNPYEKAKSDWIWRTNKNISFERFLNRAKHSKYRKITNWKMISIDDKIALDFVGRVDRILDDINKIERKLGIEISSNMNHENKQSYEVEHTDRTIQLVEEVYNPILTAFEFDKPKS